MAVPSDLEAAYSGGILDGEGNIHIGMRNDRDYRLTVQVMNTNHALLDWLRSRWGGAIYEMRGNSRHVEWSRCWAWVINQNEDKQEFLGAVLPYLIVKRRAAEIALQFLAVRGAPGVALSPIAVGRKRELFLAIRSLTRPDYEPAITINDDQLSMEIA